MPGETSPPPAPGSLAFGVPGFGSPGTPLPLLHPAGRPGCALHASPDSWQLLQPVGGAVLYQFNIPASPALAGVVVHHQVLEVEFDALGRVLAVNGSNGLRPTVGAF